MHSKVYTIFLNDCFGSKFKTGRTHIIQNFRILNNQTTPNYKHDLKKSGKQLVQSHQSFLTDSL